MRKRLISGIIGSMVVVCASQAHVFAGLEKGLGPFVVDTGGDTFSSAYLGYGRLASETFKDNPDFLIC